MEIVKKQITDFKKFILRGNVVDLAVAVVIGAAFTGIVTAFTNGIIKPMIASLGSASLGQGLGFSIRGDKLATATFIDMGGLISTTLNFVIVASVVFFFVVQPINKFMSHVKPSDEADKPSERPCPACLAPIPTAAIRCKFCTTIFTKSGGISKQSDATVK